MATPNEYERQLQAADQRIKAASQEVYFRRLAAHGIAPKTAEQAETLLQMGDDWQRINAEKTAKQAAVSDNPFRKAAEILAGHTQASPQEQLLNITSKVAGEMVLDAELANALLTFQAIEAHRATAAITE